ncbi:MAG: CDP-diacylglycerol--glycerol-3-phosphate 3-phosphatidyltransferase [Clostridiales bacterium]|nr:CDP-diacylglycerol--glycerol-3-phosphate 3-phosphatidyltransferase [Clostridiales bacterium]
MNTPNILTISRMILTPVFLAVFLIKAIPYHYAIALVIFIIGSLTDLFDGKIARKRGIVTNFGKFSDPLADKMLTTAAILGFVAVDYCNIWVLFIILFREFAVSSMRLVAASDGIVIPANMWGKVKTTIQMVASIVIMLLLSVRFDFGVESVASASLIVASALLWLMAAATAISGVVYVIQGTKVIDFSK